MTLPFVREDIPLAIVFRALGVESDKVLLLPSCSPLTLFLPRHPAPLPDSPLPPSLGVLPHAPSALQDIIQHIVYDQNDSRMLELLRPSIAEAQSVNTKNLSLAFIANRGTLGVGVVGRERLTYATNIMQNVSLLTLTLTLTLAFALTFTLTTAALLLSPPFSYSLLTSCM